MIQFGMLTAGVAQVNSNAIGLRGGSGIGFGGEITYQKGLKYNSRFELDFGFRKELNYSHLMFTIIYHYVKNITNGLNWYIGAGTQLGRYSSESIFGIEQGYAIGAGGQVGIEYDFNDIHIPLLLSLDVRPMFGFIGVRYGFNYGSLSLRYTF